MLLIPFGLLSNNTVKQLLTDEIKCVSGIYYTNVLNDSPKSINSYSIIKYFNGYMIGYSYIYAVILISSYTMPYIQYGLIFGLNLLFLGLSLMSPYTLRVWNRLNILNHILILFATILVFPIMLTDGYDDYAPSAEICSYFIFGIILLQPIVNFVVLFLRITPYFCKGVKNKFKFEPIRGMLLKTFNTLSLVDKFKIDDIVIEVNHTVALPEEGKEGGGINYDNPSSMIPTSMMKTHHEFMQSKFCYILIS